MELPAWYYYDASGTQAAYQMSEHDKQVSNWCEAAYEEAVSELEGYEEIQNIDRYINYLMGKQWSDRRPSYKASPVSNRIWTNLVQLISYLTDIRQSFEIKSNNRVYDKHAEILNKIIRAWFFNEDIDMIMSTIITYAALTVGYGRFVWNPDAKNGEGELELTPCGPLDVIPIRPGFTLQKSIGLIYRAVRPLMWFREKYPLKGYAIPPDNQYSSFVSRVDAERSAIPSSRTWQFLSPQIRRLFSGGTGQRARESVVPRALYREFWIRDPQRNTSNATVYVGNPALEYGYAVRPGERLYPRGRLICMGGPIVLYDGPNPFWHGQFPFASLKLNEVPWQWPGVSEFRNQVPLQDIMNNVLAGILDSVKRAVNPPLIAPDNAFGASVKRTLDPNMPGAKLYYSPASISPPQYAQSPSLPGFVFQTMLYAQQELDSQSGFIDISNVSRKPIIPAADTLEQMKEGQQTLVRLKVRRIESFFKEIGQQFIANVFQFYTMRRRIQMLGVDGLTFEDFDYNPATMVPAGVPPEEHWRTFQFMIQPGSLLKTSRIPMQTLMLTLRRGGDLDRDNLLEALDLGALKESVKKNLELEAAQQLANLIRQKTGGGLDIQSILRSVGTGGGQGEISGHQPV